MNIVHRYTHRSYAFVTFDSDLSKCIRLTKLFGFQPNINYLPNIIGLTEYSTIRLQLAILVQTNIRFETNIRLENNEYSNIRYIRFSPNDIYILIYNIQTQMLYACIQFFI